MRERSRGRTLQCLTGDRYLVVVITGRGHDRTTDRQQRRSSGTDPDHELASRLHRSLLSDLTVRNTSIMPTTS
jgi:hypothetical protein